MTPASSSLTYCFFYLLIPYIALGTALTGPCMVLVPCRSIMARTRAIARTNEVHMKKRFKCILSFLSLFYSQKDLSFFRESSY
jgi:hypothetical protein